MFKIYRLKDMEISKINGSKFTGRQKESPMKFKAPVTCCTRLRNLSLGTVIFVVFAVAMLCIYAYQEVEFLGRPVLPASEKGQENKPNRQCGPLTLSRESLPLTALASFPGSGNTWLRHLVQEATGVLTGSEYNDSDLRSGGFHGEGVTNSSTVLVKTHESDVSTHSRYSRAVLVIRHPKDAFLAEFNRLFSDNQSSWASNETFRLYWPTFLTMQTSAWYDFHRSWLTYPGPLLVIRYSDLQAKLPTQLVKILRFLNIQSSGERFQCAMARSGDTRRRRTHGQKALDQLYDESTRKKLDKMYRLVLREFEKRASRI